MPRVLIFKETLLPASETFILAQMTALTRHQPRLVGLEPVTSGLAIPEDSLLLSRRPSPAASLRAKLYRRTGTAPWLYREARRYGPRLVHAHFASGGRTAMHLARALRVPLIVTLHGSDVTVRGDRNNYRELGKEAALFLCVSEFIRSQAMEAGLPAEKLVVHAIGIDCALCAAAQPAQHSQTVLFVGRLVEKKGCGTLLRAMQTVQQQNPAAGLVVIGDGPLRAKLESLAAALKVRFEFRGSQPNEVVRQQLQEARLLCVPSVTARNGDSEGFGMVFAEAQAMGVPVVSTHHGGIPEAVEDGVTGLLVPERDHDALAEALLTLLGDQPKWQRFSDAGRARVAERFDLQRQTAALEDLYESIWMQQARVSR